MAGYERYCRLSGNRGRSLPRIFSVKSGHEKRPVVYVSWYGAVAYCNWLSEKHGLVKCYGDYSTNGHNRWGTWSGSEYTDMQYYHPEYSGYRLPTEAEWECACRAGTTTDFSWGENYADPDMSPGLIDSYCWYQYHPGVNGNHHEVGSLSPNGYGLYDMHGNVTEWCSDWWNLQYYEYCVDNNVTISPLGPVTGTHRAYRGGCFYDDAGTCTSYSRIALTPPGKK